jgi:hypothetical protein
MTHLKVTGQKFMESLIVTAVLSGPSIATTVKNKT